MSAKKKRISAVLLGAGESRRMGRDKLALPWGRKTVLQHCLDVFLRSDAGEVIVVLRERSEKLEGRLGAYPASLRRRVTIVLNPDFREGMGSSIRLGLRSVRPTSEGVLIGLGDQPLLKARTVNALIRAFTRSGRKIVVPFYREKRGNPVLFGREHIGELARTQGDRGGRKIIEKYPKDVLKVRIRSEGVIRDVDTWSEYRKLRMKTSGVRRSSDRSEPRDEAGRQREGKRP